MQLTFLAKRAFTKLFWLFPIKKNQVFFSSYEGKQFSCNPRAAFMQLMQRHSENCRVIWEFNDSQAIPDALQHDRVKTVRHNSLAYFYRLLTSRVIVTNSGITAAIALRPGQMNINTWHGGGAYKKVGAVIAAEVNGTDNAAQQIMANQTNWFLSSSKRFTDIMVPSVLIPEERFLPIGMPRNDIFFNPQLMEKTAEKVKAALGLIGAEKLVLFAPTYRGGAHHAQGISTMFAPEGVLRACKARFGGSWKLLVRSHYHAGLSQDIPGCINVSDYPDMQELLCAADVLITDYSSSVWDFSLTDRPGFLFTPDLAEYDSVRSFYTPIADWPYPYACTGAALERCILDFDPEQQRSRSQGHHRDFESYECGNAAAALCDLIVSQLNTKK